MGCAASSRSAPPVPFVVSKVDGVTVRPIKVSDGLLDLSELDLTELPPEVAALGGDAEVNKLRTQHDYLRKMLKESHSVLTKVLAKEGALKDELSLMKRGNERLNGTNLLYLKNVVVSFLIKIYGDADDEEHIRLAQVLQTVLHFSPEEVNQVNDKIDYYCGSWWHRTGNLLKVDPTAYVPSATLWDLFATAAPAAAPTATSLPPRAQNGYAR